MIFKAIYGNVVSGELHTRVIASPSEAVLRRLIAGDVVDNCEFLRVERGSRRDWAS